MGYDLLFSHSCVSQQFYPNGLLEESKRMCLLCLKIFIQSVRKQYVLLSERQYPQFIFPNSLIKNIPTKLHFFGLYSLFCLFLFLSLLKETLSVKSPEHEQTLTHASLKMFHPAACLLLEGLKHLSMSGVICLELMSCCFIQMTFSLIGVITIATSRHGGCLANPKINK